jgi:hypothetical protein
MQRSTLCLAALLAVLSTQAAHAVDDCEDMNGDPDDGCKLVPESSQQPGSIFSMSYGIYALEPYSARILNSRGSSSPVPRTTSSASMSSRKARRVTISSNTRMS